MTALTTPTGPPGHTGPADRVLHVPIDSLQPSKTNPRKKYDSESLAELEQSIRTHGILQPLLVRELPPGQRKNGMGWEIIAGERRFRAAKAAGVGSIPILERGMDDEDVIELQVIENLHRQDLHALEEADGYHALLKTKRYNVARIAERVGRSPRYVYDRLKLTSLTKEARKLFVEDRFPVAHALLLAHLAPSDQERCLDLHQGGMFQDMRGLPYDDSEDGAEPDELEGLKPVALKELQAWIDDRVRLDDEAPDPMLFPDAAQAFHGSLAVESEERVVCITREYHVDPVAKNPNVRTYGPRSWKRAGGEEKACEHQVTGVVVVGPGRGQAFPVCIEKKKCKVHWAAEQREAKKRATRVEGSGKTGEDKWKLEQEERRKQQARDEAEQKRWVKARPQLLEALAAALVKVSATPKGEMARLILGRCQINYHGRSVKHETYLPKGDTAESLVRFAAFVVLADELCEWGAFKNFPKRARAFGVDARKIVDEVAPVEKAHEAEEPSKAKGGKKRKKA